jgi:hypothetical protein
VGRNKAGSYIGYSTPIDEVREGLRRGVADAIAILEGIIDGFEEDLQDSEPAGGPSTEVPTKRAPNRKIFVVHGHDHGARDTAAKRRSGSLEIGCRPMTKANLSHYSRSSPNEPLRAAEEPLRPSRDIIQAQDVDPSEWAQRRQGENAYGPSEKIK